MAKNIIIGQSGGPTAVINSSLAGVYKAARSLGADKVYGMKYGIEGLLKEELLELNVLLDDRMSIELLKRTPSSYLGSCRFKLPDPDTDATPFVKLFTLFDKYDICAVFYIGGNKVGALFGEAVVIMNDALKRDFRFMMKQRGGMLAKGRLLGVQFDALFTDDLYFRIARHANIMAKKIHAIFEENGYSFLFDSPTNQQYPIMSDAELAELGKDFGYEYWERVDATHSAVRFCASWATTQENVDALRAAVQALKK